MEKNNSHTVGNRAIFHIEQDKKEKQATYINKE